MAKKNPHGGARKGAGRKPAHAEGPTIKIGASVPDELVIRLDELAEKRGWNRSQAVTEAIRRLLKSSRA